MYKIPSKAVMTLAPGFILALTIGLSALALARVTGLPASLLAVFTGVALSFLSTKELFNTGLNWTSKTILRLGVASLGLRMGFEDFTTLGWPVVIMIVTAISVTIFVGIILSRVLGLREDYGALTGGAMSICGASAAMAIAAVLPGHKNKERDIGLTIVSVTAFSTIGMILYPVLAHWLNFDEVHSAMLIGGIVHDVAQTAAAGYAISDEAGQLSVLTKMIRVSFLFPVVLALMFYFMSQIREESHSPNISIPLFLIVFFVLMMINSLITIPDMITEGVNQLSKYALITAIAAVGLKTHLRQIVEVGIRPFILMLAEALTLLAVVLSFIFLL